MISIKIINIESNISTQKNKQESIILSKFCMFIRNPFHVTILTAGRCSS